MKRKQSLKGITLVELVVVIALFGIIVAISANMITVAMRAHQQTVEDYTLQSAIRLATDKVSNTVRYSKAVFAVPESFVDSVARMDPDWTYFSVSPDGREIIEYTYNASTGAHDETVIVPAQDNIYYELNFQKDEDPLGDGATDVNDRLLKFTITAYYAEEDGSGNLVPTAERIVFSSEIEALNAIQVVDKGTLSDPSVAIAYRFDGDTYGDGVSQVATITLVLDTSGSMSRTPEGYYTWNDSDRKITKLKEALIGDGTTGGIIGQFAAEENIEVAVVPFSYDANMYTESGYDTNTFYNSQTEETALTTLVNSLTPNGNTNTGDGMRQAYYAHENFVPVDNGYSADTDQYNYMIILVDGETNYETNVVTGSHTESIWNWWSGSYIDVDVVDGTRYSGEGEVSANDWPASAPVGYIFSDSGNRDLYVQMIGQMIRDENIKTYVIGYASDVAGGVGVIGSSTDAQAIYLYSDDFDLSEVFSTIANDIMAELWVVMGPQIQN